MGGSSLSSNWSCGATAEIAWSVRARGRLIRMEGKLSLLAGLSPSLLYVSLTIDLETEMIPMIMESMEMPKMEPTEMEAETHAANEYDDRNASVMDLLEAAQPVPQMMEPMVPMVGRGAIRMGRSFQGGNWSSSSIEQWVEMESLGLLSSSSGLSSSSKPGMGPQMRPALSLRLVARMGGLRIGRSKQFVLRMVLSSSSSSMGRRMGGLVSS
jgi:hypothetical protein